MALSSTHTAIALAVAIAGTAVYVGCNVGPALEGFYAGGIEGAACPPGTEAAGSCNDPDCGVECRATTACESGETCPTDTVCGTVDGEKWCVPKTCDQTCDAAQTCDTMSFGKDVCVTR
jgi:hypothetical protein